MCQALYLANKQDSDFVGPLVGGVSNVVFCNARGLDNKGAGARPHRLVTSRNQCIELAPDLGVNTASYAINTQKEASCRGTGTFEPIVLVDDDVYNQASCRRPINMSR